MPVMALLCSFIARISSHGYLVYLGDRPLPQLTKIWIISMTQSILFIPIVFVVTALLFGFTLSLLKRDTTWTLTGTLIMSSIGFTSSLLFFGTTCLAAALPFIPLHIGH